VVHYPDAIEAQLNGATVRCTYLVEFAFKSETMRLWPGFGPLEADGKTWQGIGNMGRISALRQASTQKISEITASLFGDDTLLERIAEAIDETDGREIRIFEHWFEVRQFDEDGNWIEWDPIGTPASLFRGTMGPPKIEMQPVRPGEAPVRIVSVSAQDPLVNTRRPAFGYWSDRDQQARSPGDNMFKMMSRVSRIVAWPSF
jgi:hypothetical protein